MDQEEWELEVDRDIALWFSQSDSHLEKELEDFIKRRQLDGEVTISHVSRQQGEREIVALIVATAALVHELSPIIVEIIRRRFPKATVKEGHRGGKRVLTVSKDE